MEPSSQSVSAIVLIKNLSYVVAFMAGIEYLDLSATAVSMLAILLIIDFITGVLRAGVVDGAHTIVSSVGIRGMASKALVFMIPFVLAVCGKGVGMDLSAIAASSITVFCISTTYSILGNIHSISTGEPKREFDAIDYVYQGVGQILEKVIHDKEV